MGEKLNSERYDSLSTLRGTPGMYDAPHPGREWTIFFTDQIVDFVAYPDVEGFASYDPNGPYVFGRSEFRPLFKCDPEVYNAPPQDELCIGCGEAAFVPPHVDPFGRPCESKSKACA